MVAPTVASDSAPTDVSTRPQIAVTVATFRIDPEFRGGSITPGPAAAAPWRPTAAGE